MDAGGDALAVLPVFLALLALLIAVTLGSQLALTTLGHYFVYRLRGQLVKRILDTDIERLEQLGSASLLASLSSDIRNITVAFVRLPELVQGVILTRGGGLSGVAIAENAGGHGSLGGGDRRGQRLSGVAGLSPYGQFA